MFSACRAAARGVLCVLALAALVVGAGCASRERLSDPAPLVSPYAAGEVIWAVAPLSNETGTSLVDELSATDRVVNAASRIEGVTVLPTNRVIAAMRSLRMPSVETPADARELSRSLGADALLVGTLTAWDPYEPLELGVNLALFARTEANLAWDVTEVDPAVFRSAMTDGALTSGSFRDRPVAAASGFFTTSDHSVLRDVRAFASGRTSLNSPMGWRVYTKSMDRFTEFVSHALIDRIVRSERERAALLLAASPRRADGRR